MSVSAKTVVSASVPLITVVSVSVSVKTVVTKCSKYVPPNVFCIFWVVKTVVCVFVSGKWIPSMLAQQAWWWRFSSSSASWVVSTLLVFLYLSSRWRYDFSGFQIPQWGFWVHHLIMNYVCCDGMNSYWVMTFTDADLTVLEIWVSCFLFLFLSTHAELIMLCSC